MQTGRRLWNWSAALIDAVETLTFPLACVLCRADGQKTPFCQECRTRMFGKPCHVCPRCALPTGPWGNLAGGCADCRDKRLGFDAAVALGPYEDELRSVCLMLKKETNAWLGPWLADLLVESRADELNRYPGAVVAAIPLHWRRRWTRGYNQSEAIARRLASRLRLKLCRPLRRPHATPPLADLGRTERAAVMRQAFAPRRNTDIKGRTVLLVDDILTSGATCGSAARVLKQAGAARVIAVVIGRAEGNK